MSPPSSTPLYGQEGGTGGREAPTGQSWARWIGATAVLIWLLTTWPWILGSDVLLPRDVFVTHVPYKTFGAAELVDGRIPAINEAWGLGQPFRGNPNALPFYPGNLLYLVMPFWAAFGAHYALHWLLAGVAMAYLARRLGMSADASVLAGLTYSGGVVVSALSFYNTLAVLAWWPLVVAGIVGRPTGGVSNPSLVSRALDDSRSLVAASIACGLAILAGEPVALVLLAPTAVLVAWRPGRDLAATTVRSGVAFLAGGLLAAPQVIATTRILPFSSRGGPGEESAVSLGFSLTPGRLLELLTPFPSGIPFRHDAWGPWAADSSQLPYYYALYLGILAVPLALLALRSRPRWGLAVIVGVLLAWLGADFRWLATLSGNMFRHPEKFLLWTTPFLPLLVAQGYEKLRDRTVAGDRFFLWLATISFVTLGAIALNFDDFVAWHASRLLDEAPTGAAQAQALLWIAALVLALTSFLVTCFALRRDRPGWLLAVQLASMLPLLALLPTDSTRYYGDQELQQSLGPRTALWSPLHANLSRLTHPAPRYNELGIVEGSRWISRDLEPAVGVPAGLVYPIVVDLDGLASPLLRPINKSIAALDEPTQIRWLRALGVEAIVLAQNRRLQLPVLGGHPSPDGPVVLQAIPDPMPRVLWPDEIEAVRSVGDAFRHVGTTTDPVARPALLQHVEQGKLRSLEIVTWTPDRIVLDIDSEGGVVVLRRAFQPLYKVRSKGEGGEETLRTQLANAFLLAVEIPPGQQQVEIYVSAVPEVLAFLVSLATLATLVVAYRKGPRWTA